MKAVSGIKPEKQINFNQNNFSLEEKFFNFSKEIKNRKKAEEIYLKMKQPLENQYEITQIIQEFSEVTFHSFKKINIKNTETTLVFCCSSVSPLNTGSFDDDSFNSKSTIENSIDKLKNKKYKKRENSDPCPMRIKFYLCEKIGKYKICLLSIFSHNHSPICDDENVKINLNFIS